MFITVTLLLLLVATCYIHIHHSGMVAEWIVRSIRVRKTWVRIRGLKRNRFLTFATVSSIP